MAGSVPMTVVGKRRLEGELAELEAKRPAILNALDEARQKGDLSENAEYHAAKESLAVLEAKIADVHGKLARAQIVDPRRAPKGKVALGAKVTVLDLDSNEKETLHFVGVGEEDSVSSKLLITSPVGQGLLQKKVGDEVKIEVPRGIVRYRVLEIVYPT